MSVRYLLTGASGFLGKELRKELATSGTVATLGRSSGNDLVCDLSKQEPQISKDYTTVIHNAGKAHVVPKTAAEKQAFFDVNYQGTLHLLAGLEKAPLLPDALIFISTVAVYGRETGTLLDENTPLAAADPYGKSKIMAEEAVIAWGKKHAVTIGILRLPLVAGPNPLGNLQKMLKAQQAGYYFQIGKGEAKRSVVVARDIAKLIPTLSKVGGTYNLSDGYHPTYQELGKLFAEKLQTKPPLVMSPWLAKVLATGGEVAGNLIKKNLPFNDRTLSKMTSSLTFSDQKAVKDLNWQPESALSYFASLSKQELLND